MEVDSPANAGRSGDIAAGFVSWLGRTISWLTLIMVVLTFGIVVIRYGFNQGWIWMQESVTYLHAMVFMLAAAWAWQADEHVRVDIYYRERSPRQKAVIDLIGTLIFVVPVCIFLLLVSWNYVAVSWAGQEGSREAGGLEWVYWQKTLILVLPALLLLQATTTVRASLHTLRRNI